MPESDAGKRLIFYAMLGATLDRPIPAGEKAEGAAPTPSTEPASDEHGERGGTPESSHEDEPRCGRIMVGSGDDTYDPTCDLTAGHPGACKSYSATDQHKLSREPTETSER